MYVRVPRVIVTACVVLWSLACSSDPSADATLSNAGNAGNAGMDAGLGATGADSGGSFGHGDAAGSCSANPVAEGCPCSHPGQASPCWTGPANQRHVGACHDGTAQCVASGEFDYWGSCQGEQLDCGTTGSPDAGAAGEGGTGDIGEDSGGTGSTGDGECVPANVVGGMPQCPLGTVPSLSGAGYACCPCKVSDCPTANFGRSYGCCASPVCAGVGHCQQCPASDQQLDPSCGGKIAQDCDDFPEDCDELCCICKTSHGCPACPPGQSNCAGACMDVTSNDNACGACDTVCPSGSHCVSGFCQ